MAKDHVSTRLSSLVSVNLIESIPLSMDITDYVIRLDYQLTEKIVKIITVCYRTGGGNILRNSGLALFPQAAKAGVLRGDNTDTESKVTRIPTLKANYVF
jgi:hypothetical protein